MAKKNQAPQIKIDESLTQEEGTSNKRASQDVSFTPEQLAIVQQLIAESKATSKKDNRISVYGARDPREITHVKVSMFDGKFVIGFKDFQTNPYAKEKKLYQEKPLAERGLPKQPFVTLILSDQEGEVSEQEVALIDYMNYRSQIEFPIEKMEKREIIKDHGILGKVGANVAAGIDAEGKALSKLSLKAESKQLEMVFYVKLPGFDKPVQLTEDTLA